MKSKTVLLAWMAGVACLTPACSGGPGRGQPEKTFQSIMPKLTLFFSSGGKRMILRGMLGRLQESALLLTLFSVVLCARAFGEDFATQTVNATYKLFNKNSTATGFLVRPPGDAAKGVILVTAGHVFEKMAGETGIIVLRKPLADGTIKRRDFSFAIRAESKPLWKKHATEDVAVMRIDLPDDANVTPLPFESLATEEVLKEINLHITSPLHVLGFPARFEANAAGFPVARHASVASYPLTPITLHKTFIADFSTFSGDSGGPVFLPDARRKEAAENSPPLIVGMVLAQFRHDEKITMLYEERTIHYPLALATVLHARYVREAIELLSK